MALGTGLGEGKPVFVGAGLSRQALTVSKKMPAKKRNPSNPSCMGVIYAKRLSKCKLQAKSDSSPLGFLHQINTLAA